MSILILLILSGTGSAFNCQMFPALFGRVGEIEGGTAATDDDEALIPCMCAVELVEPLAIGGLLMAALFCLFLDLFSRIMPLVFFLASSNASLRLFPSLSRTRLCLAVSAAIIILALIVFEQSGWGRWGSPLSLYQQELGRFRHASMHSWDCSGRNVHHFHGSGSSGLISIGSLSV